MAKSRKKKANKRSGSNPQNGSPSKPKGQPQSRPSHMSGTEKVAWYSLVAMVFTVPIAIANYTWLGFDLPITFDQFDIIKVFLLRFWVLIAFGAWSWHTLTKGGRIRWTKVDFVIIALLVWVGITTVLSISPEVALFGKYRRFEGFVSFVNYAAIFWMLVQFVDRASRIRTISNALFSSAVIVNIYGLMQFLGIDPISWGNLPFEENRAFSTYGNPDLLGGFLVFPLIVSVALALTEDKKWLRAIYWLGSLLTAVIWIVAYVRGAWIGGVVGLAIFGVLAWMHRTRLTKLDWGFVGASGAALAAVIAQSLQNPHKVLNIGTRIASILDFDSGSAKTRFQIWQAAIDSIKDRPIFGYGADTFRLVFPKYKPVEYVADAGYLSVADNVHNYPLQITSALGIPGFLLLYGTFAAAAWMSAPLIFQRREGTDRLLLGAWWAACAAYLGHLMFGISVTGTSFLLWVGMAIVLSPIAKTIEFKPPKWGVYVGAVALILVGVLLVGDIIYVAADHHYMKARIFSRDMRRVEEVEEAIRLNPFNDMYRSELGLAHTDLLVGYITQIQSGGDTTAARKQAELFFTKAEDAFTSAIDFVPWEYDNYVFITNLYNVGAEYIDESHTESAIEWGEKGVEVEPFGPAIRFQLSRALTRADRYDEAREHMEFAVEMDPKYADGHLLLADIYRRIGEYELAIASYEVAMNLKPGTPGIEESIAAAEAGLEQSRTAATETAQ